MLNVTYNWWRLSQCWKFAQPIDMLFKATLTHNNMNTSLYFNKSMKKVV